VRLTPGGIRDQPALEQQPTPQRCFKAINSYESDPQLRGGIRSPS